MIETWGKNRRELRNKLSKTQIIERIGKKLGKPVLDIQGLSAKDLSVILEETPCYKPNMQEGRLKSPLIDELQKTYPNVKDFKKASVTGLKSLIGALNG